MIPRRLATMIVAISLLASCGGGDDKRPDAQNRANTPKPATSAVPAGDARIEITAPKDGETASSKDVRVDVKVDGFSLVDKIGESATEGEGHIVYYLGRGYEIPIEAGRPATSGGSGGFTAFVSHDTTYTWPDAPSGPQTLTVQLVNNDNTPLAPPQFDQVQVTIP